MGMGGECVGVGGGGGLVSAQLACVIPGSIHPVFQVEAVL